MLNDLNRLSESLEFHSTAKDILLATFANISNGRYEPVLITANKDKKKLVLAVCKSLSLRALVRKSKSPLNFDITIYY